VQENESGAIVEGAFQIVVFIPVAMEQAPLLVVDYSTMGKPTMGLAGLAPLPQEQKRQFEIHP
jgi:hypothetical protein